MGVMNAVEPNACMEICFAEKYIIILSLSIVI